MNEQLVTTPSATVGPYLSIGMTWSDGGDLVESAHPDAITISGTVYDGNGDVMPDALIEIWQADPNGRFDHPDDPRGPVAYPGFRGFGRCPTDPTGAYEFRTLKPGRVPAEDGLTQAPHVDVSVFARGMLNRTITRIYFPDEVELNSADPVLCSLDEDTRSRLIARPDSDTSLRFDIRFQGEAETPFFAL
jgi:protocatechuate 3,4-dioxygenase alpha subunit